MKRRLLENLDDEFRDHIERETQENIQRGMAPAEARRAALRKFGNIARTREDVREVWGYLWLEQFLQDVLYGCRMMRRDTGFTAIVIATLALGIGASAAAFSVAHAVLLRPLDYPHPEQLVWLAGYEPIFKRDMVFMTDYFAWRKSAQSYSAMAAYSYQQSGIVTHHGATEVTGVAIAGDFWKLTGARLLLGQPFDPDEPGQIALTWDLFQREFSGASGVVGRTLMVDGGQYHVTAVLAPDFHFQLPVWWTPVHQQPVEALFSLPPRRDREFRGGAAFAALKPGVTSGQALAELETLEPHIVASRPPGLRQLVPRLHVDLLEEKLVAGVRPALLALLAASGFVLLICAVNIANLLLARATARQTEFAVRTALGAGRLRLVRQSLAENAAVALVGALAGLGVARLAIGVLIHHWPNAVPRLAEANIDSAVVAFALAAGLAAGAIFGAAPAFLLFRTGPIGALKEGARTSAGVAGLRARRLLVSLELALAIVLLTGAGLMLKSFWRMFNYPSGFAPESTLVMRIALHGSQYAAPSQQQVYMREVLRRSQSIPGVTAAGISNWAFFSGAPALPSDRSTSTTHTIRVNAVSPGYLHAMGMRLLKGRWLTDGDKGVVMMNESMAREAFGDVNPIGRTMYKTALSPIVVGVVADLQYSQLDSAAPPEVFVPYQSQNAPELHVANLAVRTATPQASATVLRELISGIDLSQPAYDVETLGHALADAVAPRRFNFFLLGTFASTALMLAMIGIYGVLAFSVARRTREIGIRMALGAQRSLVIRMIVIEGMTIVLAGMAAGIIAAWGLTRLIASMLYGVKANDFPTFAAVALALFAAAFIACLAPAIKAALLDPAAALRYE